MNVFFGNNNQKLRKKGDIKDFSTCPIWIDCLLSVRIFSPGLYVELNFFLKTHSSVLKSYICVDMVKHELRVASY